MNTESTLLLTSEVARSLNVSSDSIRLWERTGRLPAQRTAAGVRVFRREDVDRFACERRATVDREADPNGGSAT